MIAKPSGVYLIGDAYHLTSPSNDGSGAIRCMKSALRDANIKPEDVSYINAHATSTPVGNSLSFFLSYWKIVVCLFIIYRLICLMT